MAQITQSGALNTTALTVPDLYVQIVPPQILALNGVSSSVIGAVGTAPWGKVNQPVVVGTTQNYARLFGPVVARKYDMGTHVNAAIGEGATAFTCVRVTDGTDTAAVFGIATSGGAGMTLLAVNTGSAGNGITMTILPGRAAGSLKLTVTSTTLNLSEVFDNLAVGLTNGAAWTALVNALNNGVSGVRGASQLVIGFPGVAAATTPTGNGYGYILSAGTDGATTITAATLLGTDGLTRTGMYALRSQSASIGLLADADDSTTWTTQAGFGAGEGIYMILTGPAGDTVSNAPTVKANAGLDSYAAKLMFGDWIYWIDPTTTLTRLISPQGLMAGKLSNLSPEQSSLNKAFSTVVGSQRAGQAAGQGSLTYSSAELQALGAAGIDVICNPAPGGAYWAARFGHNASSVATILNDSYTRLTNYIAETLTAGMGTYVGEVINATLLANIRATLLGFLGNLLSQGILGSVTGAIPYAVVCDATNNPQSRTSLGYVQADVQVQYQGINEKFIVNLQGGSSVTVTQAGS